MHASIKTPIYQKAVDLINKNHKVLLWTGYDDPTYDGATEITSVKDLYKVFKYAYDMGWPIIRAE